MADELRPLPRVGARIKYEIDDHPKSPSTWLRAGVVLAVAEREAMLVRRWLPLKARYVYLAITIWEWQSDAYREVKRRKAQAKGGADG